MEFFTRKKQIDDLEARVTALERTYKSLDLEWSSAYDKLRSIVARMAKRAERLSQEGSEDAGFQEGSEPSPNSPVVSLPSSLSRLTARQQAIQAKLLQRRSRAQ